MKKEKFILLTGSTDGIGLRSAVEFARAGENMIIHGRSKKKLFDVKNLLQKENPKIVIKTVCADFEDLNQTKTAFEAIADEDIKVVINNAGCFADGVVLTKDGFEKTYQVNHLAPFLITHILLNSLINNAPSKIIIVSSMAHASYIDFEALENKKFAGGYDAYSLSKLCSILFAFKLAGLLKEKEISVNCLHPGVINTKLLINNWGACGMDVKNAHRMIMYAYNLNHNVTGEYLKDMKISKAAAFAYNKSNQYKCYEISKKHLRGIKIELK